MCACGEPSVKRAWCGVELCAECFARHVDYRDRKACPLCCAIVSTKPVDMERLPDGKFAIRDKPSN